MIEYNGEWWFPANPNLRIKGTLTIKDFYSVLSVNLSEALKKDYYYYFKSLGEDLYKVDIILGESQGREITLLRCKGYKTGIGIGVGQSEPTINVPIYYPSTAFIGTHFAKLEDIHFKRLEIVYSHLSDWVNIFNFSTKTSGNLDNIIVEYKKPESVKMYQDERTAISIAFQPFESMSLHEIKVGHEISIKIEHLSKEILFEEDLPIINYIRDFLAFGMNFPIYPLRIKGITEKEKVVLKEFNKPYYPDINVFTRNMLINIKEEDQILSMMMLFSFKDIAPKIEIVINRWFDIMKSSLRTAYVLYLGTLYNPSPYIRHNFLNLIQAFEAFYGNSYPQKEQMILTKDIYDENVYKELMKKFDSDVLLKLKSKNIESKRIQDLRNNLNNKLKYGNEFSLKKKLEQVMKSSEYKELMSLVTENEKEQKVLARKIAKFRNDLSHGKEVSDKELIIIKDKLELLIKIILLKALNFENEEIINFLKLKHV